MTTSSRLAWLALFAAAIALGVIEGNLPAAREPLDPMTMRVTLAADGALRLEAPDGTDLLLGTVAEADPPAAIATLDRLRTEFRRLTRRLSRNPNDGSSTGTLDVRGAHGASWRVFGWIMQSSADPQAKLYHMRLRSPGDPSSPISIDLPRDYSGPPDETRRQHYRLRLRRRRPSAGSGLRIYARFSNRIWVGDGEEIIPDDAVVRPTGVEDPRLREWNDIEIDAIRGAVVAVRDRTVVAAAEVQVEEGIPFGDVVRALAPLQEEGVQIAFEGGAPPPGHARR